MSENYKTKSDDDWIYDVIVDDDEIDLDDDDNGEEEFEVLLFGSEPVLVPKDRKNCYYDKFRNQITSDSRLDDGSSKPGPSKVGQIDFASGKSKHERIDNDDGSRVTDDKNVVVIDDDDPDCTEVISNDSDHDLSGCEEYEYLEPLAAQAREMSTDEEEEDSKSIQLYKVLTSNELVNLMKEIIDEVNNITGLPPTVSRILLSHFKWDKERLLERYYQGPGDNDSVEFRVELFKEARIAYPELFSKLNVEDEINDGKAKKINKKRRICFESDSSTESCIICFCDYNPTVLTGLSCGHRFCRECWISYLTTKIMEDGESQYISCAGSGCDILVDDETVMNTIVEPKVRQKYQLLITNNFVECNRLLRWCPKAGCGHAIKVSSCVDFEPVKCNCGNRLCFVCGYNWHEPVKCNLLKKWIMKCEDKDNSETLNYLTSYTKNCPKCSVSIEKNGGCNHMYCRKCHWGFCWICLEPMSHDLNAMTKHNCNKYDRNKEKEAERSRDQLQRFLFYCNRYLNHQQSLKFENKLYEKVREKMLEMQRFNMSWIEVQFLKKAVDILCRCRQTLMYTYVFAYFLEKSNQQLIFEHNQSDVENATEILSGYLEKEITKHDLIDIKQKVQDKYKYCEKRRKVLVEHVKEGYEKDLWTYSKTSMNGHHYLGETAFSIAEKKY